LEQQDALAKFRERKLLVAPDALEHLCTHANSDQLLEAILDAPGGIVVSKVRVEQAAEEFAASQKAVQVVVHAPIKFRPAAADVESGLKFEEKSDVSGKSRCTGTVDDFVAYFRSRTDKVSKILRQRPCENPVFSAGKVKSDYSRKNIRVVGMVVDKRVTKNGHTLVELEDSEGSLPCLIPKDASSTLKEAAGDLLNDEVIAFDGYLSGNSLFIVKEVIWPDVPYREKKLCEDDVSIAFVSDIHVGSKYFLHEQFTNLLKFFNGESERQDHREAAGKIKYLLVAGDLVDGIGIYPSQEKDLVTKDIYTQYEMLADFLKNIPEYIEVVIGPGNHDAVRTAQPSPRVPRECTFDLEGYRNMHFVGSPAAFEVHGLKVLMYHGDSFYAYTSAISKLAGAFTNPEKVGVEMLRRRHLSPVYGDNPIIPEHNDFLVIDDVPDILHFGHVHHNGYANYRGTTVVNSGTWQDITDYIMKQGLVPTPCQLPIYNAHTGNLNVISFK